MASAWGRSWGRAWGRSWGAVEARAAAACVDATLASRITHGADFANACAIEAAQPNHIAADAAILRCDE